ncbi:hypothetical protein N665_0070s0038 [Sinapis alba]|nr:hypothetical protein N665_0070s0038 [Sinapis alba]
MIIEDERDLDTPIKVSIEISPTEQQKFYGLIKEMEATSGKFEVEKFDGKGDFGLWKYKMLCQLEIVGLGSVLKEKTLDVKDEEQKDAKPDPREQDRELHTKNLISMCLSDLILRKVMNEPTALAMWKALEDEYQTKTLPNRI